MVWGAQPPRLHRSVARRPDRVCGAGAEHDTRGGCAPHAKNILQPFWRSLTIPQMRLQVKTGFRLVRDAAARLSQLFDSNSFFPEQLHHAVTAHQMRHADDDKDVLVASQ